MKHNPKTRRQFLEHAGTGSLAALTTIALPAITTAIERTDSMKITGIEAVKFRRSLHIGGGSGGEDGAEFFWVRLHTDKLERARQGPLGEEDCQRLQATIQALSYLIELIGEKDTTISRLRALLAKPSTEKTSKVLEQAGLGTAPKNTPSPPPTNQKPGHGRNGAEAYRGARRIKIAHAALKPGDRCPRCWKGKVYEQKEPALRIRVVGQAPVAATVYELERLRCNLCGDVFEAEAPEGVGEKKYDESAAAMIGLLKYGSGVP